LIICEERRAEKQWAEVVNRYVRVTEREEQRREVALGRSSYEEDTHHLGKRCSGGRGAWRAPRE
jgi:hypothetical protein